MFHVVHLALLMQKFSKYLTISHNRPLGEKNLPRISINFDQLEQPIKFLHSREHSINLKSESPSVRFLVVLFQQIEFI